MAVQQSGAITPGHLSRWSTTGVVEDAGVSPGNAFQRPITITDATYDLTATDYSIIANGSATLTLTLPLASAYSGRELLLKTIVAFTVVSASSNVVPLATATAGTAILAASAGKWARLQSDGTNWVIMAAG